MGIGRGLPQKYGLVPILDLLDGNSIVISCPVISDERTA